MPQRHDKPDEPAYWGGEDENSRSHEPKAEKAQRSKEFPVDESDSGPATSENERLPFDPLLISP